MNRANIVFLRIANGCILGLFLVEAMVVDLNGRVFGFDELPSWVIIGGTVSAGIITASVLLWLDVGWRVLHFGCLAVYIIMLLPMFLG